MIKKACNRYMKLYPVACNVIVIGADTRQDRFERDPGIIENFVVPPLPDKPYHDDEEGASVSHCEIHH